MNAYGWNLVLALAWVAVTGDFSPAGFLVGLLLGYVVISVADRSHGERRYASRVPRLAAFAIFFVIELVKANVRIAWDVLTPGIAARPGIVSFPLDARHTPASLTLLANLITLTPGTLSLDVSEDARTLYVHVMYLTDADEARREIRDGFERRILEVMR